MSKSKEFSKVLDDFTRVAFGRKRSDSIDKKVCVYCGQEIKGFKDALSEKEYQISGLCQRCQDEVFG